MKLLMKSLVLGLLLAETVAYKLYQQQRLRLLDNESDEEGDIIYIEQYTQEVYVIDDVTGIKTHIKQPNFKMFLTSDSRLYVEGLGKQITALVMYDLSGKKIIDQSINEVNTQRLAK